MCPNNYDEAHGCIAGRTPPSGGTISVCRSPTKHPFRSRICGSRNFWSKFILVCLIAALAGPPVSLRADSIVEEIIARVNNQIITRSEYQRSKEQLREEAQQRDPANAAKIIAEKDKDVLRDLIDQQLLLEKGKDLGITADTELVKRLDEMRKQMNLDTHGRSGKGSAMRKAVSFEDFKQNLRNQIITQQVIGKEVGSRMNISKEEAQQFYEQHRDEMEQPEEIRLSEILVSTEKKTGDSSDDAQDLAAAQAKADDLLDQIRKGATSRTSPRKTPMARAPRRAAISVIQAGHAGQGTGRQNLRHEDRRGFRRYSHQARFRHPQGDGTSEGRHPSTQRSRAQSRKQSTCRAAAGLAGVSYRSCGRKLTSISSPVTWTPAPVPTKPSRWKLRPRKRRQGTEEKEEKVGYFGWPDQPCGRDRQR